MGTVIRFSTRLPSLEPEEVFDFGIVGDVAVSLVREKANDNPPLILALARDEALWGLRGVMNFKRKAKALAELVGAAVAKALRLARS